MKLTIEDVMLGFHASYGDDGPPDGVVYLILAPHSLAVKIGYTSGRGLARMAELQTGSPEPLVYLGDIHGCIHMEQALHRHFEDSHIRGEWFGVCDEIRDFCWKYIEADIPGPDFHPDRWNCHPWPKLASKLDWGKVVAT